MNRDEVRSWTFKGGEMVTLEWAYRVCFPKNQEEGSLQGMSRIVLISDDGRWE